jgi:hypothetical protein
MKMKINMHLAYPKTKWNKNRTEKTEKKLRFKKTRCENKVLLVL